MVKSHLIISNIQNDGINPGRGIHLQLHNNLLSGLIPESMCDMNLAYGEYGVDIMVLKFMEIKYAHPIQIV